MWQDFGRLFAFLDRMTSLPLVLDDEPMGIILKAGRQILRPAKIWAYCWFADEGENGDHTHRHLPVDPKV